MRGISTVLAVILVVIIVVALVGLTYSFSIALFGVTTGAGERMTEKITTGLQSQARVELMSINNVIIRNTGLTDLSDFTVLINGEQADFITDPPVIEPDKLGTITITDFIKEGDEIVILSSEGATTDIKAPDPCDQAVLCLDFDEGSGTKAKDSSPYGNDGTLYNGTIECAGGDCPNWVESKYRKALNFDGVDDRINISDSNSLDITDAITIEAWIYPTSWPSSYPRIVSKEVTTSAAPYALELDSSNKRVMLYLDTGAGEVSTATAINSIELNNWYYIGGTWNGTTTRIYLNGKLNNTRTQTGTMAVTTNNVLIGNDPTNNRQFNGIIDEIRIFNKTIY